MVIRSASISVAALVVALAFGHASSKQLTKESFKELVGGEHNLFVKYYAPWCGHCVKLEPTWKILMAAASADKSLKTIVAKVDCTKEGDLCNAENVKGYPTLKLYRAQDKSGAEYEGPRELSSLVEFLKKQLNIDLNVTEDPDAEEKLPMADTVGTVADNDSDEEPAVQQEITMPDPVNGLYELTDETIEPFLRSGRHFVEFYAPWCGHCQRLAPTWDQLAESFQHDRSVAISKIDCDQFRKTCKPYGVRGFPSLLWIVDGKVVEKYQGARTHEDLKKFVDTKVEEEKKDSNIVRSEDLVVYLTEENFERTIKTGVTFVKFLAPWCAHCKRLAPIWEDLGKKTHGIDGLRVAKVDCNQFEKLCDGQKVDGFPTLILYKNGERVAEYEDDRTLEKLHDFALSHVTASKDEL